MGYLYSHFFKPLAFRFDPEFVHNKMVDFGELLGQSALGRKLVETMYGYRGKDISKTVDGISYKTPIILSAGFDYNGRLTQILPSLSFGGEEIGSVTWQKCLGNPKPHLTRLKRSQSILVYKGLMNDGAVKVIDRISKRERRFVQGISIARTNIEECKTTQDGITHFYNCLKAFVDANVGDYYTINISCPNAFGGEDFADPELLSQLMDKLFVLKITKPVYVKMPINKSWDEFRCMLEILRHYPVNGVVIGNLNKDYKELDYPEEAPEKYRGGVSGKPCFKRSNYLIKQTRKKYGKRFTIIGCGGILTPEDAIIKLQSGADLLQLITGMIYTGPGLVKNICKKIEQTPNL